MTILAKIYYFFSVYCNKDERRLGRFFKKLDENQPHNLVSNRLLSFIQQDIVLLNVFLEWRYKAYKYLSKRTRRQLYNNAELIRQDFNTYIEQNPINQSHLRQQLKDIGIFNDFTGQIEKLAYLKQIMNYLSPKNGRYVYQPTSTFGKLLKNPKTEQLSADCNQIVTLYIYLYSKQYEVDDLKLLSFPKHVAMSYGGIGIEATSGEFITKYDSDKKLVSIQEIASINLLDISDGDFKTHKVSSEAFLQASRLAYIISSQRDVVINNLEGAYHRIVYDLAKKNNYHSALAHARKSRNLILISYIGQRAAKYYLDKNNFKQAEKYANYCQDKTELLNTIQYNHGVYCLNNKKYQSAIKLFQKIRRDDLVKKCYRGLFFQTQAKLGSRVSQEVARQNKPTINTLKSYANKSGDKDLIDYVRQIEKML